MESHAVFVNDCDYTPTSVDFIGKLCYSSISAFKDVSGAMLKLKSKYPFYIL